MKRSSNLIIGALLLAVAFGCAGEGGVAGTTNPPPPPPASMNGSYTAPVAFGNGQQGVLTLDVANATVSGMLSSTTVVMRPNDSRALDVVVPVGTYNLTGSVTTQGAYTVNANLPAPVGAIKVEGKLPTKTAAGTYTVTAKGKTATGAIPAAEPGTHAIVMDPDEANLEAGQAATFKAEISGAPAGDIRYRWFIAAPTARIVETSGTNPQQGQDITTQHEQVKVQTGAGDQGRLTVHVQAFLMQTGGTKRYLGHGSATIELADIQFLVPTWVHELSTSIFQDSEVHTYLWDFPVVAGAKYYEITLNPNSNSHSIYHMDQGDVLATPVTSDPAGNGAPYPPVIPVTETVTGVVRRNFIRRGGSIRMIVVHGDGFDPEIYRLGNPVSVKVYF